MKKSLTIILAILTLGVLLVVLWFTSFQNKDTTTKADSPETTSQTAPAASADPTSAEAETIPVLSIEQANIDSIDVTAGENSLTYVAGDENWTLKGYEDYALDQSGLNYKAKQLTNVTATRSIENASLAEYGLDQPAKVATYHLKDGSTKVLSLGNLSLDSASVYVMVEDQPTTVYVVPALLNNCMISDIDSYRNKELENYDSAAIHDLTITGSAFDNIEITLSATQNGYYTAYDLSTDDFKNVAANSNSFDDLKAALPSFKVGNFVADNVTDLSAYGLDQPVLHLIINYYDPNATTTAANASPATTEVPTYDIIGQVDYIWGNTLDNGEIAFMKTGDTSVYSMDASFLADLKEAAKPFKLTNKFIELANIANVSSVDITLEDSKYHLTVDKANENYTIDNQTVDKDNFKTLYQSLIGIRADIMLDEKSSETTPVATITYTMNDGSTKTATFFNSTNNQYYQTYLNDVMLVGVTKTQLNTLKTNLTDVKAGKTLASN